MSDVPVQMPAGKSPEIDLPLAALASGEYILATNSDIIFGRGIAEYLGRRCLRADSYYRAVRYDITPIHEASAPTEEQERYWQENWIRAALPVGLIERKSIRPLAKLHAAFRPWTGVRSLARHPIRELKALRTIYRSFLNCSGDFFLLSRDAWHELLGYPELDLIGRPAEILLHPDHLEDRTAWRAMGAGSPPYPTQ